MFTKTQRNIWNTPKKDAPSLKIYFWSGSNTKNDDLNYRMMYENGTIINPRNQHESRNFVDTGFMDGSPNFGRQTGYWTRDNGEQELLAWVNYHLLPFNAKIVGQDTWTTLSIEFDTEEEKITFVLMYL